MTFDGAYEILSSDPDYFGVYAAGASAVPPANAVGSFWVKASGPNVAVKAFVQTKPDYTWLPVSSQVNLPTDEWLEVQFTAPDADSFHFGVLVISARDYAGTIHLDEVSW